METVWKIHIQAHIGQGRDVCVCAVCAEGRGYNLQLADQMCTVINFGLGLVRILKCERIIRLYN